MRVHWDNTWETPGSACSPLSSPSAVLFWSLCVGDWEGGASLFHFLYRAVSSLSSVVTHDIWTFMSWYKVNESVCVPRHCCATWETGRDEERGPDPHPGDWVMTQRSQYHWQRNLELIVLGRSVGGTRFGQGAQRDERKAQANALTGFSAEKSRQGSKQLKSASSNHSGWLWVAGVVSGMSQSRGLWLGAWQWEKEAGRWLWAQDCAHG